MNYLKFITAGIFLLSSNLIFNESSALANSGGCGSGSSWYLLRILSPISAQQFDPACHEHDKCYETFGKPKGECDKAFHNRMLGICARDHNTWGGVVFKRECNVRADAYYEGVQTDTAQKAYNDAQKDHAMSNSDVDLSSNLIFDSNFYRMAYVDLRKAFGENNEAAHDHWLKRGLPTEGRTGSSAFDVKYYLDHNPDLKDKFGTNYAAAANHWLTVGIPEGKRGSLLFDVKFYLDKYPDLKNAYGTNYAAAINHWVGQGMGEARQSSADFDVKFYISNPDVAKACGGATNYKCAIGNYYEYGGPGGRKGVP